MTLQFHEVNYEGIPGPTHMFSGLGSGNMASKINEGNISSPKKAALQSLEKTFKVFQLGIKQALVLPQRKPNNTPLNIYGFKGSPEQKLKECFEKEPKVFASLYSSSSMWTANAATVSPSPDTEDGRVQITIANLKSNFHRSLESFKTYEFLRKVFTATCVSVHSPLQGTYPDEGAANHLRFCKDYGEEGLEVFVFGMSNKEDLPKTKIFKPRQSKEACQEIIKLHKIKNSLKVMQHPDAIDFGVFHNDVISTANKNLFLFHEKSFYKNDEMIDLINNNYKKIAKEDLILIKVSERDISINEAVTSYLFNSQILSTSKDSMLLLAPVECKQNEKVKKYIDKMIISSENPIEKVEYVDLKESMQNGGGPACLRLRVVLSEEELKMIPQKTFFNEEIYSQLKNLIENHYPEELKLEDLIDPKKLLEINLCFDKYEEIFNIRC